MLSHIREDALNETYMTAVFGRLMAIAKGENPEIESHDHVQEQAEEAAKAAAVAAAEIEAENEKKADKADEQK